MVKITFKTVQNKLFTVDAEETETVVELKKKIQESQTFPVENQKLIYSGKILQDGATVASLKIKEKDFLVVMVSKPKAAPAAAAPAAEASSAPAPAPAAETPAAPSAPAAAPAPSTESAPAAPAATEAGGQVSSQGGSFVIGAAREQAITSMVEMGFERDLAIRALRASFNNPDRAVEYLMSGNIPNTGEGEGGFGGAGPGGAAPQAAPAAAAPTPAAAPAQQAAPIPVAAPTSTGPAGSAENLFAAAEAAMNRDRGAPAAGAPGAGGAGAAGAGGMNPAAMEALMNNPQMAAVRQAVQQNPALIQPLLQQLAASQPALAQMIAQNPEMLYQLLGAGAGGEGDDEEDYGMGGAQTIQVDLTADEAAAVERLEGLGFPRQMVLQAFMLCDKNEELAANFLFDQGEDD